VVFGDGIESDHVDFRWGVQATMRVARERLRLVEVGSSVAGWRSGLAVDSPWPW